MGAGLDLHLLFQAHAANPPRLPSRERQFRGPAAHLRAGIYGIGKNVPNISAGACGGARRKCAIQSKDPACSSRPRAALGLRLTCWVLR